MIGEMEKAAGINPNRLILRIKLELADYRFENCLRLRAL